MENKASFFLCCVIAAGMSSILTEPVQAYPYSKEDATKFYQTAKKDCHDGNGLLALPTDIELERCSTKKFVELLVDQIPAERMTELVDVQKQCDLRRDIQGGLDSEYDPCQEEIYDEIQKLQVMCPQVFNEYTEPYYECPRQVNAALHRMLNEGEEGQAKEGEGFLKVVKNILKKILSFAPVVILVVVGYKFFEKL